VCLQVMGYGAVCDGVTRIAYKASSYDILMYRQNKLCTQQRDLLECIRAVFPERFFLADPFWLRKITTGSQSLAHVNIGCPNDRYPNLKIRVSEMI
jgi:hypothetical protein